MTESTLKESSGIAYNRFFSMDWGEILQNYTNGMMAADTKIVVQNFINALENMPQLLAKYQVHNERISNDIPLLKNVVKAIWCKEDELKGLKTELNNLERQIKLSL